ncbi:MAG TPA: sugar phosphate isomerase/epimerase [Terriglobia bacterium]|nr:sugar phosphate isomerase/epimerase [Terriglobia bacterium]
MKKPDGCSRRFFLTLFAAAPLGAAAVAAGATKKIPIGLELYSVRNDLQKDLAGTVRQVAKMGYQCVEFYSPYYDWTASEAKKIRRQMDSLGIRCYSTHNDPKSFTPAGIGKAMELNGILGTRYIVMASAGDVSTIDGWKRVAETLNKANHTMAAHGLHAGYHNHDLEWKPVDGQKPIEVLAANTDKSIMLQLDVGTCLETGNDPVAWIKKNPGRIRSLHLKNWSPKGGYKVLFSEGVAPWKKIFAAAESVGGVEYYLIEQEGSRYSEIKTVELCLQEYRKLRA